MRGIETRKDTLIALFNELDSIMNYKDMLVLFDISKPTFYSFKKNHQSKKVLKKLYDLYIGINDSDYGLTYLYQRGDHND